MQLHSSQGANHTIYALPLVLMLSVQMSFSMIVSPPLVLLLLFESSSFWRTDVV